MTHTVRLASGRVVLHNGDFTGPIEINATVAEVEALLDDGEHVVMRVTLPLEDLREIVARASTIDGTPYLTTDLTDEALAEVHRWHAIVHLKRAADGVFEPDRNPGGCDQRFCLTHLVECSAVAAPRWYAAGYAEAEETWRGSEHA